VLELSEIDYKLDLIIEKLTVSKLDNSFLLSFSFLSVLFSLGNLILADLLYREILTVGAILYFLFSFHFHWTNIGITYPNQIVFKILKNFSC
jgi:hypothetical protein